ncbi:MAG: hypothetical protein ACTSVU_07405 [Promethearchaeota archaeon]
MEAWWDNWNNIGGIETISNSLPKPNMRHRLTELAKKIKEIYQQMLSLGELIS